MQICLKSTGLHLRNSILRIPFRYGSACLTRCPQAVLQVTVESAGKTQDGYSGDCLPPSWFDKTAGRGFADQIDDMIEIIGQAATAFQACLSTSGPLFPAWLEVDRTLHQQTAERGLPELLASFGVSMVERALMDAIARLADVSFAEAVRSNLYAIQPDLVHHQLAGWTLSDWLPTQPRQHVYVRHTVGLADPLTAADVSSTDRLDDGFPQTLEQYLRDTGIRYLKIKVANEQERDLERLRTIASLLEQFRSDNFSITLDGNEQYKRADDFLSLVEAIQSDQGLQTLWNNVLVIEQPLDRRVALQAEHSAGLRALSARKPVIIDESDGDSQAYPQAVELGYRGVSSKNCKGPTRSLLNAGLTWLYNEQGTRRDFLMTGEDLCSVGVIPVQADLCLAATLGLDHVERNGHHFHPGLTYLTEAEQQAAWKAHPDFYTRQAGRIAPHLVDGQFKIKSLQCPGFGFAVTPDLSATVPADEWDFASLGLPAERC